ncbi:type VI secretion system tip protein TssI/VgrG [Xenorhabdus khoisanae]|uniref:type VI secretion system Vgr family protein n=1 Tax=Xenorhabdus khoisanae TaxID=880157 RepID=UPI002359A3E4|nr:type VI secretion system tip protein TssI/VgrG [Xenorhabdus khoisanae]MDC9613928.1 type VI secretion system tip protein TssI/VgrG [Xenorhabdus khoisanae]
MERFIIAHSSLGDSALLFKSLKGEEKLSTIYSFEVELFSDNKDIDIKALRNKPFSVEIKNPVNTSAKPRYLSGLVREAIICDYYDNNFYLYKLIIQPALFTLTLNKDFKIWQKKTAPEIIKDILDKHKIKFKNSLNAKYQSLEYCTQYKETDFDFLSRIMEREGIYYYFQHSKNEHTLILADSPQSHSALPEYSSIEYYPNHYPPRTKDKHYLYDWTVSYSITPKLYTMSDYNFLKPNAQLKETQQNPDSTVPKTELFEWPGNYGESSQGQFYVRVLQQSSTAHSQYIKAKSQEPGIAPGYTFTLSKALRDKDNDEYLIVSANYEFHEDPYIMGVSHFDPDSNKIEHIIITDFTAIPSKVNWRAPRITPWPVANTERATVVGASGKTIWTDEHGRVKLKFHWDRSDTKDDKSSCWVRVSNNWAGAKFGMIQIPRVGEEVIVSFIHGNPDEPLIVGRSFNKNNMPPWTLPKEATKIGIMSRSLEGGKDNASYLFIDDAQGKESFEIHAEKDMKVTIEKNQTVKIDGTRETTVEKAETANFKDKQKTTVAKGKEIEVTGGGIKYTVSDGYKADITGDKSEKISENYQLEVGSKSTEKISSDYQLEVGGNSTEKISSNYQSKVGGNFTQKVTGSYELKVTGSKTDSVTGSVEIKGSRMKIQSSSTCDIKGTLCNIKGISICTISAALIKLG